MRKLYMWAIMFLLFFGIGFSACSDSDVQKGKETKPATEKGAIDKMTDKAAAKAVDKIRTPIDKARSVQNLGEERANAIDKATGH